VSRAQNPGRASALSTFIVQLTAVNQLSAHEEREAIRRELWRAWRETEAAWHRAKAADIDACLARHDAPASAPANIAAESRHDHAVLSFMQAADRYVTAPITSKGQCKDKIARMREWRYVASHIRHWDATDAAVKRWTALLASQAKSVGLDVPAEMLTKQWKRA
jgi:hypothetical protein